jgi:hypothetical protein
MPARRGTRLWISGVLGLAVVAGAAAFLTLPRGRRGVEHKAQEVVDEKTPMPGLALALRDSDARALAVLFQMTAETPDAPRPGALSDQDAAEWIEVLKGLRTGFLKFGSYGRASALTLTRRVLDRFAVEPVPVTWVETLTPAHDLLTSGLADANLDVRVTALMEIGAVWNWVPGRTLITAEEDVLDDWKQGLTAPVVRHLGDREPKARAAAVACLGRLRVDGIANEAIPYLEDPTSADVRKQVLVSFATRPALLTEDAVLRHMFDKEAGIPEAAEIVLRARGLSQEQISLGSMIFHPKAEIRASVISLLKERSDIDPVVWLLQLSRDADETVRIGAVEALARKLTPEVGRRLAEMAATDKSPAVRRAASKHLPDIEKTAALPPLPGSPRLNPKAN